jgi:hypothetical protein
MNILADMLAWASGDTPIDDMSQYVAAVEAVNVPEKIEVAYVMPTAAVPNFDERTDLLDRNVREFYQNEPLVTGLVRFTVPTITTMTLQGTYTNVSFNERHRVGGYAVTPDILAHKSNYEKAFWPNWQNIPPPKTSNRGRKKKPKKTKARKRQGTGDEMDSQITYIMRSQSVNYSVTDIIPHDVKKYKFKVFRTGGVQIPGAVASDLDDVISCAKILGESLNLGFHIDEDDVSKMTQLAHLNPTMINFKFQMIMPENYIIMVDRLKKALVSAENPPCKFTTRMSENRLVKVSFSAPTVARPDKAVHFSVFQAGRINILGGVADYAIMRPMCEFIHRVVDSNWDNLVGPVLN